jgi:hypothetical protein
MKDEKSRPAREIFSVMICAFTMIFIYITFCLLTLHI